MASRRTAEKIAAATLSILEAEGAPAVSLRRVAATVGITPMAIYHHFPNRQALLTFVTDREFERLADHMRARQKDNRLDGQLLRALDYYLDYALAHPRIFDYVFSQPRPDARRFPDDFVAKRSLTVNRVADTVAAAMRARVIKEDDIWEVSMTLWAHIHGYIALHRAGRFALSDREFRRLCDRSMRRLIHGLKS